MVNLLRRFSQPLMVIFTVLVIVAFAGWGPSWYAKSNRSAPVAIINGKPVSEETALRERRVLDIHAKMGGIYAVALDPAVRMSRMSRSGINVSRTGIENSLLFEGEADALGITASAAEMEDQLTNKTPAFAGQDGKFDPAQFEMFAQQILQPEGFSKSQIEIFLRGEIRLRKVADLLGSLAPATPSEIHREFVRERLTTEASYIALKAADFRKDQKVTEDDLKKRYEVKKDLLKTEEKRKVRFAAFTLPPLPEAKKPEAKTPDGKPPEEPKRTEELQKLANDAYDFAAALAKPGANFDELAKAAGAKVGETAEFFGPESSPAEIESSPRVAAEAFKLTKEKPYSGHLSLQKGTYVLALKEIKEPEQMTLEQARKQLEAELLEEKTDTAMRARAEEIRGKLIEAKKAGKSFYEAAQTLGVKAEPFPAFSAMQPAPPQTPYARLIPTTARKLAPGDISDVIIEDGSALLVHVDQRPPVDEKGMDEARAQIAKQIENGRMGMAFEAWIAERRQAAGLKEREAR